MKLIKCHRCGKVVKESETFRCEHCYNIFCMDCSPYKDYPSCIDCDKLDRTQGANNHYGDYDGWQPRI